MGAITQAEKDFIRENYEKMTLKEMAFVLRRHKDTLGRYATEMGFKRRMVEITDKHREFVIKHHKNKTIGWMAQRLEIPYERVRQLVLALGLNDEVKKRQKISRALKEKTQMTENPNPVTELTRKLVCRYHHDGLDEKQIFGLLKRTKKTQQRILMECMRNGEYRMFNSFR